MATKLTTYPPSMFHADGQIWVATGKSTLRTRIQVEVSQHLTIGPTAIMKDVSAAIGTVGWPAQRPVAMFVSGFVYLYFNQNYDFSTKSSAKASRATVSCIHHLTLTTPLPARDAMLKNYTKTHLNTIICEQILNHKEFLQNVTQDHKLVVTGDKPVPTRV